MMNANLPNRTLEDILDIAFVMRGLPRHVRDISILESENVVDCRDLFLRRSRMAEYLCSDGA
jgi:hypothetical protein